MGTVDEGSITRWLGGLRGGDEAAARALWERYFARMVCLARARLQSARRLDAAADEEDAALRGYPGIHEHRNILLYQEVRRIHSRRSMHPCVSPTPPT